MLGDIMALRIARGAPAQDVREVGLRRELAVEARHALQPDGEWLGLAQGQPAAAPQRSGAKRDIGERAPAPLNLRATLLSMTREVPNLAARSPTPSRVRSRHPHLLLHSRRGCRHMVSAD
ncbi:hypothetical protein [Burkholderia glumae]|uniref:hypothetical protein n=1 Tax=Burkholderia glumae TaxID=337 RepID=UPI002151149B|nr:hypothetical protein [Burkholderia glumae]